MLYKPWVKGRVPPFGHNAVFTRLASHEPKNRLHLLDYGRLYLISAREVTICEFCCQHSGFQASLKHCGKYLYSTYLMFP